MKKSILTFAVILTALIGLSSFTAEELVGRWESNPLKQEATPEMPMSFTEKYMIDYKADNTCDFKSDASFTFEIGPGADVDIFVAVDVKGAYTCAGDSITVTCDPASVKIKFTEDDVRVRGVEDPAQATEIQNQIYQGFSQQTEMMKEAFNTPQVFNEVLITGKKMVCKSDGEFITFKRKK